MAAMPVGSLGPSVDRILIDFNIAQVHHAFSDVFVEVYFDVLRKFFMLRLVIIYM